MESVPVDAVKPGQVIARAVTNAEGVVLCPAGFTLTETAIDRLTRAGIEFLVVESDGAIGELETRLRQLKERFRGIDDPLLLEMRDVVEKRLRAMLATASEGSEGTVSN